MSSHELDAEQDEALDALYVAFSAAHMMPLWREIGDLMSQAPPLRAVPHVWSWNLLLPLARQAGDLVPVGRGGERRAIGLANPGLGGRPYATPTLWAAIQYLGARENAPEHRHSQNAFRFVLEGEGVWTVVDGDSVAMRRGDLLLTPAWHNHGHFNATDRPMVWLDGLDIPLCQSVDAGFFAYGVEDVHGFGAQHRSRSERLWAHPGLQPIGHPTRAGASPLMAYRWDATDRALSEQQRLADEGYPGQLAKGHVAVRYSDPLTGGDILPTIRAEFHRLSSGASSLESREVGSCVFQVFSGSGTVLLGGAEHKVETGDVFVVPSWVPWTVHAAEGLELFRFSDAPVMERLHYAWPEQA